MKRCPQCQQTLPRDAFAVATRKRDGLQSWCRNCMNAKKRAYYAANPEAGRIAARKWRDHNPEKVKEQRSKWRDNSWYLRDRYCMTLNDYDRILEEQGGLCANRGCGNTPASGRRFHVDHDHSCCPGERSCGRCIRGLLCGPCNRALGNARDNAARLHGLAEYVSESQRVEGSHVRQTRTRAKGKKRQ